MERPRTASRLAGWQRLASLAAAFFVAYSVTPAAAESYPSRPIEFIVPWGAGGGSDQTARQLAEGLEKELSTSVPVLNVPGGTGVVGMNKLLSAPADGYTIYLLAWDTLSLLATRPQSWDLDSVEPLGVVIQLPFGFFVEQNSPIKSWDDLVAKAKAEPGKLTVAMGGFGSPDELTMNGLAKEGIELKMVPFAKPGERFAALLGNHVDLLFSPIGNVAGYTEAKQMRPILVMSEKALPGFEGVPTAAEKGLDLPFKQTRGVVVKAGTDPERVKVLTEAIEKVVAAEPFRKFLEANSAEAESYVSPADSGPLMQKDLAIMKASFKESQN